MQWQPCFAPLFDALGENRIGFDDFRANGLLLPANDAAALRLAMPLHRGPHRRYSGMVSERIGRIEAIWRGFVCKAASNRPASRR